MDPLVAELTVVEVEARLARSRARAASLPTILILIGLVDVGGSIAVLVLGRDHLLAYFVPAQVLAFVLAFRRYRHQAQRTGYQPSLRPWIVTAAAVTAAAAAGSRVGFALDSEPLTVSLPFLAYAGGYLALARWARNSLLTTAVLCMPLVTLVAVLIAEGDVAVALQLVTYGVILLVVAARSHRRSR